MGVLGEGDRIRHFFFFILKAAYPPLADFKSFGLDDEQVCAAIVSDVLCWIKHLLVSAPDQIAIQKAMPLTIGVWYHGEDCFPIRLLNRNYRALPFSTAEHNLEASPKMEAHEWGGNARGTSLRVTVPQHGVLQPLPRVGVIILESGHIGQPRGPLANVHAIYCRCRFF